MRGIISYGAYIPYNRLQRKKLKEFFGASAIPGERSVAGFDEDAVSMSVEAGFDGLVGVDEKEIKNLYFATTTSVYDEKSSIPTIQKALDLSENVRGFETSNSLRSGTSSLIAACETDETTLVLASDLPLGAPNGGNEQLFGDGAVSFVVGSGDNVIARLVDSTTLQDDIISSWRSKGDDFVRNWEERFVSTVVVSNVQSTVNELLERNEKTISDIAKVVISAPGRREYQKIAGQLKCSKEQVQDPLFEEVGQTGTAHAGMVLASALEEAKPNDTILVVNYAEGVDVLLFEVTEAINQLPARKGVKGYKEIKNNELKYSDYLKWREIIKTEPPRRPDRDRPSAPAMYRNYDQNLGFYGSKCKSCGTAQYPKQRVCVECQAKDQMEDYRFVGKTATITTYTLDYLAPSPASPEIIAVIDFKDGGRIMCEVTDCDPEEVKIGMEVELTFRHLYEAGGIHNYYWKARPKR